MAYQSQRREEAVPKYFRKTPDKPNYMLFYIIAGIAAVVGLIAMIQGSDGACLGIPLLIVAGWLGFKGYTIQSEYQREYDKAEPKPSDSQMDEWKNQSVKRIETEAIEKLDLNPEQILTDPMTIVGPSYGASVAVGKDDILRFSKYDVVVIYLTDYHLATYEVQLDMAKDRNLKESTQEYHYTDIVAVSTVTENNFSLVYSDTIKKVKQKGEDAKITRPKQITLGSKQFALSVASGEQIKVAVSFVNIESLTDVDNSFIGARLPEREASQADKAIKVIRAQLREKKGGAHM